MKRHVLGLALGVVACSDGEPTPAAADAPNTSARAAPDDDPLLSEARRSIRDGMLPEHILARIEASPDPRHRRAQIYLGLVTQPRDESAVAEEPVWEAPSLVPANAAKSSPSPDRGRTSVEPRTSAIGSSQSTPSPRPRQRSRSGLRSVAVAKSSRGVKLSLRGGSDLTFTVVRQPERNLVRLVVDTASVDPRVFERRVEAAGVRVTDVRQVQRSIFITVQLDDGWELGRTSRSRSGTTLEFLAPAG